MLKNNPSDCRKNHQRGSTAITSKVCNMVYHHRYYCGNHTLCSCSFTGRLANFTCYLCQYCRFFIGFSSQFFGHSAFSFPSEKSSNRLTAVRFFAVAVLGFIANQSLIVLNLMSFDLPFWFVLGIAMFIVAISTYLLSRYWAFKVG